MYRSLLFIVSMVAAAHAFGGGAPVGVCEDLTPKHPADPQAGPSPYKVSVSKNAIHPGEKVKVILEGLKGAQFKGFLLQARVGTTIVGSFEVDPSDADVQTIDCPSGLKNAVTHRNPKEKTRLVITWVAPKNLHGTVVFKATFVKDGLTFWVGQNSATVSVGH